MHAYGVMKNNDFMKKTIVYNWQKVKVSHA